MHDDDRLAGERAVFLPIDPMLGKSRRSQMARPDEGRVRRLVVGRGRLGACIHGNYFCDKSEVGCECEQGLDSQLTPKSRALPPPPSTSPAAVTAPVVHILRRVWGLAEYFAS